MQARQSYSISSSSFVVDTLPMPSGCGFGRADAGRQTPFSPSERERLDNLIGQALLDQDVSHRLIVQRDPTLLDAFGLSDDTRQWLATIQATSLKEFAQAIVAGSQRIMAGPSFRAA